MKLSDLYDADRRTKDAEARKLAAETTIPHPLNNVYYADAISPCRHAKRHRPGELCRQEVVPEYYPTACTRREMAEVDAVLVDALHQAWLRAHLARLDENHSARTPRAYLRAGQAKRALAKVWADLGLDGSIRDPREPNR